MSGSKDKKRRQDQKGHGAFDLRNPKEAEAELTRKKQTRTAVIVLVAVAVVGILLAIVNSGFFYRNASALRVDGTGISITEMSYYFSAAAQNSDEDQDQDALFEHAAEMAARSMLLRRQAEAAGLTVTEEWQVQIDAEIQSLQEQAEAWNMSANSLAAFQFGRGMNLNMLRSLYETMILGQLYVQHAVEERGADFTQAELEEYYQAHRDEFELVDFRIHSVSFTPEADIPALMESEDFVPGMITTLEDARATADAIAQAARADGEAGFLVGVLNSLDEVMREWFDEEHTLHSLQRAHLGALDYGDWLSADQRTEGDVTVVVGDHAVHVVFFLGLEDNRYYTTNVRHILIRPEEVDTSGFVNPDLDPEDVDWESVALQEEAARTLALTAAELEAEAVLEQWRAGAATEESFIELVREYSADYNEGADDPGFFGDINRQSQYVPEFLNWATDTSRRVGDVDIVQTQFGFHIMYFVGYNDEMYHRYALAQGRMAAEEFEEWLESTLEAMNPRPTLFARFVGGTAL